MAAGRRGPGAVLARAGAPGAGGCTPLAAPPRPWQRGPPPL